MIFFSDYGAVGWRLLAGLPQMLFPVTDPFMTPQTLEQQLPSLSIVHEF